MPLSNKLAAVNPALCVAVPDVFNVKVFVPTSVAPVNSIPPAPLCSIKLSA